MSRYFLKNLIFSYPKRIISELKRILIMRIKLRDAIKVNLSDEILEGDNFYCVSDETQVRVPIYRVFNHILKGDVTFKTNPLFIKKYSDATIFPSSDFILTNNNVIWPKYNYVHFTKIIPGDRQLIKIDNSNLFIKRPKKIHYKNVGFSLCGVHSTVWAHFLVQYLPKIEHLDKVIKDSNDIVTLITPNYIDPQINEIINKLAGNLNGVEIFRLCENEAVVCNKLYYLENTSRLSDHAQYISPSDCFIPNFVGSFFKEKFIDNPLIFSQNNTQKPLQKRKLFIARQQSTLSPLSGLRNLINYDEVENFFKEEGFELIFPHEFSLDEKKSLFSEASIIVGPYSSGFSNIIFCQPNTKVLVFLNFQRVYETYLSSLASFFRIDLFAVTGKDSEPGNIHSSYSIPLSSIKAAYKELINQ